MNSKEYLFQLIYSLTKAEKRGFSMYLKRYKHETEGNAEILFESFSRLSEYDEKKIKSSLPHNIQKNFSYEKGQLLQSLLSFIAYFNRNSSLEIELQNLLIQIEILINKKQLPLARKLINKGIKLAEKNNKLFFINRFQATLLNFYSLGDLSVTERKQLYYNFQESGEQIAKDTQYRAFREMVLFYFYFGDLVYHRNSKVDPEIVAVIEHELIKNEENASSIRNKRDLYKIKQLYYRGVGDFEKTLEYTKKLLILSKNKENNSLIEILINQNAYINGLNQNKQYQEAKQELVLFKQFNEVYKEQFDVFDSQAYIYLDIIGSLGCYLKWFDFEKMETLFGKDQAEIEKTFTKHDFRKIDYLYFLIIYFFVLNNWTKTIDVLLRYESEIDLNLKIKNVYFSVKSIAIIAHFEQKSAESIIKSQFTSLYSFSRKNGFISKLFYKEILTLTRQLSTKPTNQDLNDIVQNFLDALEKIPKYFYPGHETLLLWAQSRLSNKSMLQLSKQKNKEIFPEN